MNGWCRMFHTSEIRVIPIVPLVGRFVILLNIFMLQLTVDFIEFSVLRNTWAQTFRDVNAIMSFSDCLYR